MRYCGVSDFRDWGVCRGELEDCCDWVQDSRVRPFKECPERANCNAKKQDSRLSWSDELDLIIIILVSVIIIMVAYICAKHTALYLVKWNKPDLDDLIADVELLDHYEYA